MTAPIQVADRPTRERVARSLLVDGPSTAAALAARLQLTAAAVRRHLDQLLEEGEIEAREPRERGQRRRGRPAKVFALTDLGRDRFDQAYDDLAVQAMRFLAETGGPEAVRAFAERRADGLEQRFEAVRESHPDIDRSQALARALTEEGYAATVRDVPVGEQLCQQHCPVSHVAHEFPELCEAETAAISRMLGRHVQRLATIAHGDGVCTTCIPESVGERAGSGASAGRPGPTPSGGASTELAQSPHPQPTPTHDRKVRR